jgi:hypothetical protein
MLALQGFLKVRKPVGQAKDTPPPTPSPNPENEKAVACPGGLLDEAIRKSTIIRYAPDYSDDGFWA